MGDFIFVLKSFVITVIIVILMQIKVGPSTLEQHSLAWIHTSWIVGNLQSVANGAVKATQQGFRKVATFFDVRAGRFFDEENQPGSRWKKFDWRRHAKEEKKDSIEETEASTDVPSVPTEDRPR